MAKLVALFDSDLEAGEVIDTLTAQGWVGLETEIISVVGRPYSDEPQRMKMAPPIPGEVTPLHTPTTFTGEMDAVSELGLSDEEAGFFRRGVQGGGVLLVADVDEERVEAAREILRDGGGRFAQAG